MHKVEREPSVRDFIPIAEPSLGAREIECVTDAVQSGWVSSIGRYVTLLEEGLAQTAGARNALAVSSGTAALHLALAALDIGPGDEVIVPSLTFVATASAVRYVGATPVFADSSPGHWCLDPDDVAHRIGPRTSALLPVHLYGHPADMDTLRDLADANGLAIVEDAAEAIGASYRGRPAGCLGDAGIFSFYGNKLITTGEGGALLTNDARLAERVALLRDHAMDPNTRYWHAELGFNYRMTNLQAALGVAQLERLTTLLSAKRAIADRYREALSDLPGLAFQVPAPWAASAWWMTTLLVTPDAPLDRDTLAGRLRDNGVDSRPAFIPIHLMPTYRQRETLAVAEAVGREGLSLPSAASLITAEQEHVIATVQKAWHR
jgi:perosamine synthetase